jgi:carbonic anhydrase/acetyltransferase-like protein (isoleucine patch superfamily)
MPKEHSFIRTETGVLSNKNIQEYDMYVSLRQKVIKEKSDAERIKTLETKVDNFSAEIEELKKLIKERLNV